MISIEDLVFLAGAGLGLAGCWLLGPAAMLLGGGVAACVGAMVLGRVRQRRSRRR